MGKVEMPRCADARGGVRSLPTDGSPNIGGYSNCGGLSQALTARSECYAALVFVFAAFGCNLVATRLGD